MRIYESEELKRLLGIYMSRESKIKDQVPPKSSDRVEISKEGETLFKILKMISSIEEPNILEKLNRIKQEIEEGRYSVDEKAIVDKMLTGEIPEDIIKAWIGE